MLTTADLLVDNTMITTSSCMFDTGALQASFIRQDIVDSNPLIRSRIRDCNVNVTLGDGTDSSSVPVSHYVQLQVRCSDTAGISYTTPPIWLLIIPQLAEDVIIGLPHLVRHLPDCFVSHIMAAISDAHTHRAAEASLNALHARHTTFRQPNSHELSPPQPCLTRTGSACV